MSNQTKTRYLVTYAFAEGENSISVQEACSILGITETQIQDGVQVLATDHVLTETDVLHFGNIGITSLMLDEQERKKIEKNKSVIAVEEDVEMKALAEDYMLQDPTAAESMYEEGFKRGYSEFYQQIYQQAGGSTENGVSDESLVLPQPVPFPRPIPPFVLPPQPVPWNINMVRAPKAWKRGITGLGVKVAVLDTGITAHHDLTISGGASFVPGVVSFNDGNGHGTHCAGIIAARNNFYGVVGVAPRASLYAVKVLGDNGIGNSSWIIAGMDWSLQNRMDVVSMSLGGANVPMVAYANAVLRLQNAGVVCCIAAGNSFGSGFPWVNAPANSVLEVVIPIWNIRLPVPNASPIAVGAIDQSSVIAHFSSRGAQSNPWNPVSLVAPGVGINSTYLSNSYRSLNGTSMATPHVAGAVALLKQRFPGISVAAVKARLASTATDLGALGYDITHGAGLINCDAATL